MSHASSGSENRRIHARNEIRRSTSTTSTYSMAMTMSYAKRMDLSPDLRFQAFAIAWALWTIARYTAVTGQYLKQGNPIWLWIIPAVMLSGLVLSRPSSVGRLAMLAFFTFVISLSELPFKANQQALSLLVCMVVLLGILYSVIHFRDDETRRRNAFSQFAPSIRIMIVLVYFWAFVHKLNSDYFGQDGCAFFLYELILDKYGLQTLIDQTQFTPLNSSLFFFLISLTVLLAEGTLGFLFLFRRTWRIALVLMLILHIMFMAVPDNFIGSFSATMWAMAACFVPNSVWLSTRDFFRRLPIKYHPKSIWVSLGAGLSVGLLLWVCAVAFAGYGRYFPLISTGFIIMLWVPVALMMLLIILKSPKDTWKAELSRTSWMPAAWKWSLIVPACTFFLGLMLYTDIRNETGFAMFSNLRSDAIRTNHFFIPKMTVMNDGNERGVRILETNEPRLSAHIGDGKRRYKSRLTWFELRRRVADTPEDMAITYQRDGEEVVSVTRSRHPKDPVFEAPGPFESRLRMFTTIPENDTDCPCRH